MRSIESLFSEYAESHRHPKNVIVHKIFVPLIMLSVVGLFWAIPAPGFLAQYGMNWSTVLVLMVLAYYLVLSVKYFLVMLPIVAAMYYIISVVDQNMSVLAFSLVVFIVSWAAQFWGHKVEGKKPSFFKDLLFLLVGPLWVAKSLFRLN